MNITIQLPTSTESPVLRDHADRELRFALTRFTNEITTIRLRLVDENGPRGGIDQRCLVHVVLRTGPVSVEGVGSDAHAVIHDVVARAARTVARRISRARETRITTAPFAQLDD